MQDLLAKRLGRAWFLANLALKGLTLKPFRVAKHAKINDNESETKKTRI